MRRNKITYKIHRTPDVAHIVIRETWLYATPKHRKLNFSKPINVSIPK